jgi:hypothetical protein
MCNEASQYNLRGCSVGITDEGFVEYAVDMASVDVHITFHKAQFMHPKFVKGDTHTDTVPKKQKMHAHTHTHTAK